MESDKKLAKQVARGVVDFLKKVKKEHLMGFVVAELQKEKDSKKAVVFAPTKLNELDRNNLTKVVAKLTGESVDEIDVRVDESLIDGLKIIYNDKLWDFSLSTQIKNINKN